MFLQCQPLQIDRAPKIQYFSAFQLVAHAPQNIPLVIPMVGALVQVVMTSFAISVPPVEADLVVVAAPHMNRCEHVKDQSRQPMVGVWSQRVLQILFGGIMFGPQRAMAPKIKNGYLTATSSSRNPRANAWNTTSQEGMTISSG